jgi:hypothetical protein
VSDSEIDTSQSLEESNLLFDQEIGAFPLEYLVGLLLHNNDDITGLGSWELVSLSVEGVGLPVRCTLVDLGIDDLLFLHDFLAIASLALILLVNDFTLSTTVITATSGLCVHAGSELLHFGYLTATSASATLLNGSFFAALTSARCANSFTVHSDLGLLTHVDFLKSHLQWVLHGLHLLGSLLLLSATLTTKHLTENVVHSTGAATAALLEAFLTILVVGVTLLFIREHFVGTLELLESVLVTTTIGVILEG